MGEAIVSHTSIDLHFADSLGHDQIIHAVTVDGYGWRLRGSCEGFAFARHCYDWQSVERAVTLLRLQTARTISQRAENHAMA